MDGWMDEWADRWMDEVDQWTNGYTNMNVYLDGRTDRWKITGGTDDGVKNIHT